MLISSSTTGSTTLITCVAGHFSSADAVTAIHGMWLGGRRNMPCFVGKVASGAPLPMRLTERPELGRRQWPAQLFGMQAAGLLGTL